MLEVFLVLLVIAVVLTFIYMKWIRYRAVGQTEGVCVEVKTECEASNGSPYNRQLGRERVCGQVRCGVRPGENISRGQGQGAGKR